ncbi:hypothetical protein [Stenotrophomonas indicatrix]|uniref:hypothetical protein n=1 Tax=Stenotrophomonas indicatrix TaxID=2045451 RepID=UPI0008D48E4A|nr:hypothetical protein [Stenotrophomonas indicatrix]SEU13250.1 hypothetical protein SAMN05720615_11869 [Stenotrophomonas indicatrix]
MSAQIDVLAFQVDSLPPDMQQLLADLAEDAGATLPRSLPLRRAPVSAFPSAVVGTDTADNRGEAYVRAMVGQALPPMLVTRGFLIDGRHRICALRAGAVGTAEYLDLSDVIPVPPVPCIGAMRGGFA